MEITSNYIRDFARFASIKMPIAWLEKPRSGGYGRSWLKAFSPPDDDSVQIGIYYDGLRLDGIASGAFRITLFETPKVIFDQENGEFLDEAKAVQLSEAFGNAGQNQLTMPGSELELFFLSVMETVKIDNQRALRILGYFKDSDNRAVNYYESLAFDGDPEERLCEVHQLYFQAPNVELFSRYKPLFEETIMSIILTPAANWPE